jgi:hypothetical protein
MSLTFSSPCTATGRESIYSRRHAAASQQTSTSPYCRFACVVVAPLRCLNVSAETHPGRARCAQGHAHAGILQRDVRHRVFTAVEDSRRQVDEDGLCSRMRASLFWKMLAFLQHCKNCTFCNSECSCDVGPGLRLGLGFLLLAPSEFRKMFNKQTRCHF